MAMKAKADRIVDRNIKFHWRFHGRDIDAIEMMLQQKIKEKTNGGPHELRRAFGEHDLVLTHILHMSDLSFKVFLTLHEPAK